MAKPITQEQYDRVKELDNSSLSFSELLKIVPVSGATLSLIRRSKNLDDYRRLYSIQWKRYLEKKTTVSNSRIQPDTGLMEFKTKDGWKVDVRRQLEFWKNASIKDSETKEDYFPKEIIINGKTYRLVE